MSNIRSIFFRGVVGASRGAGLELQQLDHIATPAVASMELHDQAEEEVAGTPHIVEFTLNRAMRREIGGKALTGTLSAPEGSASKEQENRINDAYDLVGHRARSTQRTLF